MPFIVSAVGAVVGAVKAAIGASALFAAAAQIAGSVLLSAAASRIFRPKQPKVELQDRQVTIRQPIVPREMVYGRVRKGGVLIFAHATDNPTFTPPEAGRGADLNLIIVLAPHKIRSIGACYFDGEIAVQSDRVSVNQWADRVELQFRYGDDDQPPMWELIARAPDLWNVSQRLRGVAYVYMRLIYGPDAFPRGIPNIAFDIEGKSDIFIPTTGTREYTDNAALCLADYMAHPVYGLGAEVGSPTGIDQAALIEASSICSEWVSRASAPPERRYTCNGVVDLSRPPKENIEAMLTAMAGRCVWQGGAWKIMAGAYRTPHVTLTEDDVRPGGLQLASRVPTRENFNAVRGTFISPENDWQPDDFPPYASAAYLAEDGGVRKWTDITLPFTISSSMAQRLAKIELERARRQFTLKVSGKLSAWRAATGETVNFDYARWGFANKPFEVAGNNLELDGAALGCDLTLRETSPLVYSWSASEEQIYDAAPRTNLPGAFDAPAPGAPVVAEDLYETREGAGVRALVRVTWPAGSVVTADRYELQTAIPGQDFRLAAQVRENTVELFDLPPGVRLFRVRSVSALGVASQWSAVTTRQVFGLGASPVAVTGLSMQSAGGLAILQWDRHPALDVRVGGRIEIRHSEAASPGWASSVSMAAVPGDAGIAVVPLKPGTYAIRAYNAAGTAGAISTIATSGATVLEFAPVQSLTEDAAFSGAKTDTVASGGALSLDTTVQFASVANVNAIERVSALGGFESEGLYGFATGMDLTTAKRVRLRTEIRSAANDPDDEVALRVAPINTWANVLGADGAEVDVIVEARTTEDDPAGTPAWTEWDRVSSGEVFARGVQARARLTTADPSITPLVTRLRLHAEEVV